MSDSRPLGIFDSGVGGLTVAKEIKRICPQESIIYYGDSKHLPYGNKSPEVIKEYSTDITRFLIEQGCKMIVVACNTASANAIEEITSLANEHQVKVIDVINPVAKKVAFSFHQEMGVIATKATVNSKIYRKRIRKFNKHIKVKELATPLLVPVIEEGLLKSDISKAVIKHYLSNPKLENIDSIILGCTHYPLITKEINDFYEGRVDIIDSPLIVANDVALYLNENKLLSQNKTPEYNFYMSDITANFKKLANKIFGKNINAELKLLH